MQQGVAGDPRATVLVVDDEQTLREMIGINLNHAGIDVIDAATGLELWNGCRSCVRILLSSM